MRSLLQRWHRFRRRVLLHRRPLAALLAGAAVLFALQAAAQEPPPTEAVWTAARDLPSGAVITEDDLRAVAFAEGTAPAGTLGPEGLLGRTVAVPLRRGEPVTAARLVGPGLADGRPGEVVVPVRITDAEVVPLLHVGDRVDLVAVDPRGSGGGRVVATQVTVLALPDVPEGAAAGPAPGRLIVVSAPREEGDTLAALGVTQFLTVQWSG